MIKEILMVLGALVLVLLVVLLSYGLLMQVLDAIRASWRRSREDGE